jgi:pimeloyl-ACP methyl ester carboxylesterase
MAAWATQVMDELDRCGVGRTVFVGHSMGGWLAQQVWRDHRERVLGIGLVGVTERPGTLDDHQQFANLAKAAARRARPRGAVHHPRSTVRPVQPAPVHVELFGVVHLPERVDQLRGKQQERGEDQEPEAVGARISRRRSRRCIRPAVETCWAMWAATCRSNNRACSAQPVRGSTEPSHVAVVGRHFEGIDQDHRLVRHLFSLRVFSWEGGTSRAGWRWWRGRGVRRGRRRGRRGVRWRSR